MLQQRLLLWLLYASALVLSAQAASHAGSSSTAAHVSPSSRYVVAFADDHKQGVQQQLKERGYKILSEGPGFFTVAHSTSPTAAAQHGAGPSSSPSSSPASTQHRRQLIEAAKKEHQLHVAQLSTLPGVHSSEQDVRRFLHIRPTQLEKNLPSSNSRTLAAASDQYSASETAKTDARSRLLGHWHLHQKPTPKSYDQWGADVVDTACAAKDMQPLPDVPDSEVIPWGIKEIGAWNQDLQQLPHKGRTIVCIIDSGLWGGHPEYSSKATTHNTFSGCEINGSCPFEWSSDIVGHGTHVAGTISAPANGVGVVGVLSQGAEIHVVRVWNESGDVSQGQGPYATDLVLAYNHCLTHLKAEQAKEGAGKKVNMVINMSFGSAGPLTVERLWIEKAAQRGDVLFVGSAGNNGSWLDVGRRTAGPASLAGKEPVGQYLSYPASYRLNEMMSVANARCDGSIEFTSQKNKQVSIAAPGMAILSSVPREYGFVRGHITTTAQVTTGAKTRSVGYLANGFLEPRPIQGAGINRTQSLPLVTCSLKEDRRVRLFGKKSEASCAAKGAVCMIELPGKAHMFEETCAAMAKCVKGGGAGLVVWKPQSSGEGDAFYSIPATQLDCGSKCKCWTDLQAALNCNGMGDCSSKAPPGVIISPKHAAALLAAGAGKGTVQGSVANYEYNYKYFDGTSMAAPHVSGAAALLWRQFPACKAADIANALKLSAQRLPGQQQVPDYAAGYGMLKVDKAFEWIKKNNPCAQ